MSKLFGFGAFGTCLILIACSWIFMYRLVEATNDNHHRIAAHLRQTEAILDTIALLHQLNAPGNDVLESWNYPAERAKLEQARASFEVHDRTMEDLFAYSADLMSVYDASRANVKQMLVHADAIFRAAETKVSAENAGDLPKAQVASNLAAARMAMMDQSFARATKALRDMDLEQRRGIHDAVSASSADKARIVSLSALLLCVSLAFAGMTAVSLNGATPRRA